jgi:methionine aminopeptidase
MITDKISEQDITKYNTSARICGNIMLELLEKIKIKKSLCIKELEEFANNRIEEECIKIYKKEKIKGVAIPTSISLNNCVGNYLYEEDHDSKNTFKVKEYNYIKNGDIVKIEMGVNLCGCIVNLGETIIYSDNKDLDKELFEKHGKYLDLLEILKRDIIDNIKIGETNDEIKINIESKCTEYGCFPVENTISYQHLDGQLQTDDSKYIICNYKDNSEFDMEDSLNNLCFEFEEGEIYTINLKIIPNDNNNYDETMHQYYKSEDFHIYRFNDKYYNLKLKASREFCSIAKGKHYNNAFNCLDYKKDSKHRLGIRECFENGILERYPILYSKDNLPIYHKKFTIIVGKDKTFSFKCFK